MHNNNKNVILLERTFSIIQLIFSEMSSHPFPVREVLLSAF